MGLKWVIDNLGKNLCNPILSKEITDKFHEDIDILYSRIKPFKKLTKANKKKLNGLKMQ
jgi:hypothetical protein